MENTSDSKESVLIGRWRNELGSVMIVRKAEANCFEADYYTAVGNSKLGQAQGTYAVMNDGKKIVLAFSVVWIKVQDGKDKSSTAWSGVVYPRGEQGEYDGPVMYTTWTLTHKDALWANTNVGKDRFVKEAQSRDSVFNLRNFQYSLKTKYNGRSFIYRRVTSSTMNLAKREIEEGAISGTIVLADEQTDGKASKDTRVWESKRGNLYFSLVVRSEKHQMLLHISAVAVALTCRDYGVPAEIKWPNDIWVKGRKLSGMICWSDTDENKFYSYNLGVGINVNREMINEEKVNAISVSEDLGRIVDREKFLADYLLKLEQVLEMGNDELFSNYTALCLLKPGDKIDVFPDGVEKPGKKSAEVVSYTPEFLTLNVKNEDGKIEELSTSEVSKVSVRPK